MKIAYKKPVPIHFFEWDGHFGTLKKNVSRDDRAKYFDFSLNRLRIKTLEGYEECPVGNVVIRGVKGEYYSCKPDIFRETYNIPKQ